MHKQLRASLEQPDPLKIAVFACAMTCFYAARLGEFTVQTLSSFNPQLHIKPCNISHRSFRIANHGIFPPRNQDSSTRRDSVLATLEYLMRGISFEAIKVIGRWSSDAFYGYLLKHKQILAPYLQAISSLHKSILRLTLAFRKWIAAMVSKIHKTSLEETCYVEVGIASVLKLEQCSSM